MTEQRPIQTTPVGALRFNTDSSKLEYFDGNQYVNITTDSPEQHTGGTRGFAAGAFPSDDTIDFFQVDITGNSTDFGNLIQARQQSGSVADRTRAVIAGGHPDTDVLQFITMSSQGDATDAADLTTARHGISHCIGDSTRGILIGGTPAVNTIEYVTIQSLGTPVDFGDMITAARNPFGNSSPTRGIYTAQISPSQKNTIEYITISTLGNASDFGDMSNNIVAKGGGGGNSIRGILINSAYSSLSVSVEFVTMATLGNAQDFGDLLTGNNNIMTAASSPTRIVRLGGYSPAPSTNVMEYAQIMTTGDFLDFGDLTISKGGRAGFSNGHGGLG